jgi:hypothetical protein
MRLQEMILNIYDLAHNVGVETSTDGKREKDQHEVTSRISRAIYKDTECGASVHPVGPPHAVAGVLIGSIVEGTDAETYTHRLEWPITREQFWAKVQEVEDEALSIWYETHGCEDCWSGDAEQGEIGERPVDPSCPSCDGDGIVI